METLCRFRPDIVATVNSDNFSAHINAVIQAVSNRVPHSWYSYFFDAWESYPTQWDIDVIESDSTIH